MDDTQINGGIVADDEVIGEDFYEKIEAPKFVDLTAPDRCRTENDDDRYWFCLRAGCDQKHEEEMDSEAIYKNFVLRVMAARSPSVRLRKASSNLQCPRTVPAKSSKSRVSKLAMISSISQKMGEAKRKVRPVPKQSATAGTPNVKTAKQSSTKALTTPRNKKGLPNPGVFRSVRNPKLTTIEVPKNRMVAKALVFHSPKKAVKLKKSVELSSSLRKMCAGMKKLEISEKNKLGCSKPVDGSRKQMRGREVKSRVYDSLYSQNQKKQEAKPLKCLKKKIKEKELPLTKARMCLTHNEKNSTEMEVEAKSGDGSLEVCSTLGTSKNCSKSLEQEGDQNVNLSSDIDTSKSSRDNEINKKINLEENTELSSKDNEIPEATAESDDKENALASHVRVSESKVMEIDDKENASASDENRKLNCTTAKLVKNDVLVKHEASKSIQKVTRVISNNTLKENSTSAVNGAQGMKYKKPKFTNPKPFRLRTDERRILKEANLEKKHFQEPMKETTFPGSQGGNSGRKHQNVQRNGKCFGQTETITCTHEGSDNEPKSIKTCRPRIPKGTMERELSTTAQKRTIPMHQKTKVSALLEKGQDKATAQLSECRLEKRKSPSIKQLAKPQGVASNRKKLVSPGQLGVIKETSDPDEGETSITKKGSASNASRTSPQRRRRHTTIPKEPNFHSIHMPKDCTRRVLV